MRILFLALCIISGLSTGLWWTGNLPFQQPVKSEQTLGSQIPPTGPAEVDDISAAVNSDTTQNTALATDATTGGSANRLANQAARDARLAMLSSTTLGSDLPTSDPQASESQPSTASTTDRLIRPAPPQPLSYYDGIARVAPAVVSIYASNRQKKSGTSISPGDAQTESRLTLLPPANDLNPDVSQGSGVIVDAEGIVLTNLHLIDNFDTLTVVLSDGRQFDATLIGSDVETDLAVVRIDTGMLLPAVALDEAQPLRVGDIVLAIGNPFGVGQTVTQGIVSATRRRIASGTVWQDFVQIDAAINPGNSGGALINSLGQLVGVNTAVFRGDSGAVGIGYAIPAELLSQVVPQIIEFGFVTRGWLGLGVEDINMFPALTNSKIRGPVITSVDETGPAFLAGVEPMDVVVQFGEQPMSNATQFLLAVSALPPGATVSLVLQRSSNGDAVNQAQQDSSWEERRFKVRLGSRPKVARLNQ